MRADDDGRFVFFDECRSWHPRPGCQGVTVVDRSTFVTGGGVEIGVPVALDSFALGIAWPRLVSPLQPIAGIQSGGWTAGFDLPGGDDEWGVKVTELIERFV